MEHRTVTTWIVLDCKWHLSSRKPKIIIMLCMLPFDMPFDTAWYNVSILPTSSIVTLRSLNAFFMGSADKCASVDQFLTTASCSSGAKSCSSLSRFLWHGSVNTKWNFKLCLMSHINPIALTDSLGSACHLRTVHELQTNVCIRLMLAC